MTPEEYAIYESLISAGINPALALQFIEAGRQQSPSWVKPERLPDQPPPPPPQNLSVDQGIGGTGFDQNTGLGPITPTEPVGPHDLASSVEFVEDNPWAMERLENGRVARGDDTWRHYANRAYQLSQLPVDIDQGLANDLIRAAREMFFEGPAGIESIDSIKSTNVPLERYEGWPGTWGSMNPGYSPGWMQNPENASAVPGRGGRLVTDVGAPEQKAKKIRLPERDNGMSPVATTYNPPRTPASTGNAAKLVAAARATAKPVAVARAAAKPVTVVRAAAKPVATKAPVYSPVPVSKSVARAKVGRR